MLEWLLAVNSLLRELRKKAADALARIEAKDDDAAKLINGYMKADYQALNRLWDDQCWRSLKFDHPCSFKIDQGETPIPIGIGCG